MKKLIFKKSFSTKSFHFRIFISTLVTEFLSLLLFALLSVQTMYSKSLTETLTTSNAYAESITHLLEQETKAIRYQIDNLTLDSRVNEILLKDNQNRYDTAEEWNVDYRYLERITLSIINEDISNIKIITQNYFSKLYSSPLMVYLYDVKNTDWYLEASATLESYFFNTADSFNGTIYTSDDYIYFTRNLTFLYSEYPTYFTGAIKKEVFDNLLSVNNIPYLYFCLMNSQDSFITDVIDEEMDLAYWVNKNTDENYTFSMQKNLINDKSYYTSKVNIENTDLSLIYIYDYRSMGYVALKQALLTSFFIFLVTLPFILLFSHAISYSLSKRLEQLKQHMLLGSKGDFDIPVLAGSEEDEISILNRHFNYMMTKISQLMDEQYISGKRIKELELVSLQAQINPHFLYNTLDLIKWKAIKNKDSEIEALINSLSEYYRIGLSSGKEKITLELELEHIKSYVFIQNKRFDNGIQLDIEIPGSLQDYLVPKLTLQPIIENAIIHGILEKTEQSGIIKIYANETCDYLYLYIKDNGIGIHSVSQDYPGTEDANISTIVKSGYGLRNIEERIKLTYGKDYGIQIQSEYMKGTLVTLVLPSFPQEY